jgi:hypothetical protein
MGILEGQHLFGAGVGALGLSAGMQVSGLDSIARMMGSGSLWCFERNHGALGTRTRLGRVFLSFLKGFLAVEAGGASIMDKAKVVSLCVCSDLVLVLH